METFHCDVCGLDKPIQREGGTGYAKTQSGHTACYACCADLDRDLMIKSGKWTLYLVHDKDWEERRAEVTNWPGTLRFKTGRVRVGRHNMAGKRYDVWFTGPDGKPWHGVTYGDNTQICHCARVK